MKLTEKQIAQIKLDTRKLEMSMSQKGIVGPELNLLEMIEDGFIEIVGEKPETNELIYKTTDKGIARIREEHSEGLRDN